MFDEHIIESAVVEEMQGAAFCDSAQAYIPRRRSADFVFTLICGCKLQTPDLYSLVEGDEEKVFVAKHCWQHGCQETTTREYFHMDWFDAMLAKEGNMRHMAQLEGLRLEIANYSPNSSFYKEALRLYNEKLLENPFKTSDEDGK